MLLQIFYQKRIKNKYVENNIDRIRKEFFDQIKRKPERLEMWNGKTAKRCLAAILNYL